jgi:hypothetical protein
MQIVYLSNRPDILRDTLSAVDRFMTFVDEVVIVIPGNMQSGFDYVNDLFPAGFIHDESLARTGGLSLDHQTRDYLLRACLSEHPAIAEEFIMSDDDYRPLVTIDPAIFKENGKHNSYYFYDLADWIYSESDFDIGQQNTYQVMKCLKYPHLSYASHMPQIVRKDILGESKKHFSTYSARLGLCEWSTYFNYAHRHHPELFYPAQPYKTLCWPDCVTCWPKAFEPDEYLFENYSPRLYAKRGPFSEIAALDTDSDDQRFTKILAWYRHEINVLQGKSLDTDTFFRRFANRIIRPLRRLKDVLWLRERGRMIQFSDRLKKLNH